MIVHVPVLRPIRTLFRNADAYTDLLLGATVEESGAWRKGRGRGRGKKGSLRRAGEFAMIDDDEEDEVEVCTPTAGEGEMYRVCSNPS